MDPLEIARRFAATCGTSETLVRFGQELFLVLTHSDTSGEMVERWHEIAREVQSRPLKFADGACHELQLTAGERIVAPLSSYDFDAYLFLESPDGSEFENDDYSEGSDARIDALAARPE